MCTENDMFSRLCCIKIGTILLKITADQFMVTLTLTVLAVESFLIEL